jgi:hypothetical protein
MRTPRSHLVLVTVLTALAIAGCVGNIGDPGLAPGASPPPTSPEDVPPVSCDEIVPAASEMRRLSVRQYQAMIRDVFDGEIPPSTRYPGATTASVSGFSTEPALYAPSEQGVERVMEAAEEVALAVHDRLETLLPCASEPDAGEACAAEMVARFARRAMRRTPTDAERELLLGTYRDAVAADATFAEGIALATALLFQLPQVVYVIEEAAGERRALTGVELASRLSFLLWDSIPDDELLDLAESGGLDTPEAIEVEARRMLESPRADGALARFVREWTQTHEVSPADKDTLLYPDFDAAVARSMNESFDRLAVLRAREGTVSELLRSPEIPIDATLAGFLGVPAPGSGEWSSAVLEGRAGIVMHPAMLAALAHGSDEHPAYVPRGVFVRERLLCDELGTPPAAAMAELEEIPLPPDPTARERSDAVIARPTCGGCHAQIDPPGLALEAYDAVGRFRSTYDSGRAIEVAGEMTVGGETIAFADAADMVDELADHARVRSCFARQAFRFAMSRTDRLADGCAIEALTRALETSDGRIADVFVAMTTTDAFRYRRDTTP